MPSPPRGTVVLRARTDQHRKVDNPTNVMGATNHARRFWSFDDPVIAELARTDPSALIGGATGLTVIDEVQSD